MTVDTWLEVRPCNDGNASELDREVIVRIPTLSEAMRAAEGATGDMQGTGKVWEYSIKIEEREIKEISGLFSGSEEIDEGRAVTRTINIRYNDRCYALTLFGFKE